MLRPGRIERIETLTGHDGHNRLLEHRAQDIRRPNRAVDVTLVDAGATSTAAQAVSLSPGGSNARQSWRRGCGKLAYP